MNMRRIYCTFLLAILFFANCLAQRTTLVSCDYDKKRDQTNYMVFPYGSVSIPGKWEQTSYNSTSKQQYFKNEDTISIAISFGPCNKYEFNTDNSKKGFDFVRAYYEWDSEYFVNTFGLQQYLIEENEINSYIIWHVYGDYNESHFDTYFLFGEKKGFVSTYSITGSKWTVEQKLEFLKELYFSKEKRKKK